MSQAHWLRQVENLLLKAGLPASYVSRTCLELSDHVEACRDMGEEATLLRESPQNLSDQLVLSYRKRGVWRRIPPVVLLLLPLPIAVLMTMVYYQICYVVLQVLFDPFVGSGDLPMHVAITMWALFYGGKLAGPLFSGLVTREIARRMSRPWGWAAALFVLQCCATAVLCTSLELSPSTATLALDLECDWPHRLETAQLLSGLTIGIFGYWVVARLRFEQLRLVV